MPGKRFMRRQSNNRDKVPASPVNSSTEDYASDVPENFVTQPPKPAKGLTGKISTLFRRDSGDSPVPMVNTKLQSLSSLKSIQSRSQEESVGSRRGDSKKSNNASNKRIFYSSHQDDDSDDSYESRVSRQSRSKRGTSSSFDDNDTSYNDYSSYTTNGTGNPGEGRIIQRYRGFSTSIRSLFLDESLVCGACGCFGLILSNRTEYLLQLRNERRGTLSPKSFKKKNAKQPSKIIAVALCLTILLMCATFIIWGFGTGNGVVADYINGYDYRYSGENNGSNNDANNEQWWDDYLVKNDDNYKNNNRNYKYNNDDAYYANDDAAAKQGDDAYKGDDVAAANDDANQANNDDAANDDGKNGRRDLSNEEGQQIESLHRFHGIYKIRDYQELIWYPVLDFVRNEWYQGNQTTFTTMDRRRRNEEADADDNGSSSQNSTNISSSHSYQGYRKRRDIASDIRIALLFCFLFFLAVMGRRRRMRTRFYLVRARAQEDHLYYASSDEAAARRVAFDDTREDQYEGACSHTLCGCYPVDELQAKEVEENVEVSDKGIFKRKKKPHNEDIAARTFNCLLACCCGIFCKCWFQCLSICALAQEAREVRLLIPPRYQRVDYITHQPFHEYQEAVNNLRRGWLGKARRVSGIMPHFNALSRLSRYILVLSLGTILVIVGTLLFNPRAAFSWQDAVVLVATFVQSFLVLFFVHWIFHKSDLSLDAVIKLFASGFLIAVPTAFFFEGLMVNIGLLTTWVTYDLMLGIAGENFGTWFLEHYRVLWLIAELFNAYVVAAVTEELCKYYSFRAMEHPDLIFLTGLQRNTQDETAVDGGLVKYPFASHQVQELAREKSSLRDDESVASHRSSRSKRSKRSENLLERTGTTEAEFEEDELDVRTRRQKAMAITTGMISVAVGLACAENFLYVFVLGGALGEKQPEDTHKGDVMEAWIVLFFRSIFPVHALAAAMQSIKMIQKFVEGQDSNGHRVGVGRIILPAVILHGSFDAVLMSINVFVETAWDQYYEDGGDSESGVEPYNALVVNLVAWISITLIMIAGLLWYYRENRVQRERLKLLEEQDKTNEAADVWADPSPMEMRGEIA
jgi:hypothetical protein